MLLPAILLDRLIRYRRGSPRDQTWAQFSLRRCIPVVATTLIIFVPWGIRSQLTAVDAPVDQLLNHSYATALFHYDSGDPRSPRVSARDWSLRILERGNQISAAKLLGINRNTLRKKLQDLEIRTPPGRGPDA